MWRILSAFGVAVVMLWASAASADTTYKVTWRDTTFEKITSRFGITRDELFAANPGKRIPAFCYGVGEIHQTRWGRNRAKCWRLVPYTVAGDVWNIPTTRVAMNTENRSLRQERDGLAAERDDLQRQLDAEHQLRVAALGKLAQARAENRDLAAAVKRLRAREARSTSSAVALGSAGTAGVVVLLAFIILFRERVRTGKVTRSASLREKEADAALRGIREQERLLSSRELKAKDREADLQTRLGKTERDAQTAGRRLAEVEAQRVVMDARERSVRAREDELEQVRLRQEALLARHKKEEAEASARELAAMRIETELRDIRKEREALESERLAMRQEIEAEILRGFNHREQRLQIGMNLVEGVDQERLRLEVERTELERRIKDLEERQAAVTRREDDLAAYYSLKGQGPLPQNGPPRKRPTTVPIMSAVTVPPGEATNGGPTGGNDLERENTGVRTAPKMPAFGAAPAEPEPTPAEIPRAEPPADEAQGDNGDARDARGEEVTRRVLLPGLHEHDPSYTVTADGINCECGAGHMTEERWAEHNRPGSGSHLRCTYCSPAVVIQKAHRARHLKRTHPEVADHNPLSARRQSRPPKDSSGSGD